MFNAKQGYNLPGTKAAAHGCRVACVPKRLVMNSKTSKVILIAFTLFTFLAVRTNCIALPVDLGTAGLGYWTVLEVGSGTVTQSQSGAVMGNVGFAQNGDISATGLLRQLVRVISSVLQG